MKKYILSVLILTAALFVFSAPRTKAASDSQENYQYASLGKSISLQASSTIQTPVYEWQYSEDEGKSWIKTDEEGFDSSKITITMTREHHGRQYRCKISGNNTNLYSRPVTVWVLPTWTTNPKPQAPKVGEVARFTAKAEGGKNAEIAYHWQYSNDKGASWKNSTAAGCKTDTLLLTVKASFNGLYYRCVATDSNGKESYSGGAGLLVTPEIREHPESRSGKVGESVKFTVKFAGAAPKYQWQYSNDRGNSWKNSTASGNKTATLQLKVKAGFNNLRYRCQIKEGNGFELNSQSAYLTVLSDLTLQPISQSVKTGEVAVFSIGASGAGLKYQWQYSNDGGKSWRNSGASGNKTASLKVTTKAGYTGLQYRCVITDANGKVMRSHAAVLTVVK